MKKLLIAIGCIIALMVALLIWQDQSRDYYCFSDGKCFTLWKHNARGCYFIPGKYRGVFVPKDNYILKTDLSRGLGVINDKRQPNKIIVEGDRSCLLVQKHAGMLIFYNDEGDNIAFDSLYTHDAGHYNNDLEYYSVDVKEMTVETNVNHGAGIMSLTKTRELLPSILFIVCGISLFPLSVVFAFRLMDKLQKK